MDDYMWWLVVQLLNLVNNTMRYHFKSGNIYAWDCVMLNNCCLHIFLITYKKSLKVFQIQHVCQNQECNLSFLQSSSKNLLNTCQRSCRPTTCESNLGSKPKNTPRGTFFYGWCKVNALFKKNYIKLTYILYEWSHRNTMCKV